MTDTERDAAVRAVTVERFGDAPPLAEQERTDERGAAVAAIRALADFYETNPGMPLPRAVLATAYVPRDVFQVVVAELGLSPYGADDQQADYDLVGNAWTAGTDPWTAVRVVAKDDVDRPL